jgi:hypothetical protein
MIETKLFPDRKFKPNFRCLLLVWILVGGMSISSARTQSAPATTKSQVADNPTRYLPNRIPRRAEALYESIWGVGLLSVKAVESGQLIRFKYYVLDAEKAKTLNDKRLEPSLIFPEGHVKLVIPSLEKVGQLRQSSTPQAGKAYWMAFSNPGGRVKRGDHVDVIIGQFRAEGLVVE